MRTLIIACLLFSFSNGNASGQTHRSDSLLATVRFKRQSIQLSKKNKSILDSVVNALKADTTFYKLIVIGHWGGSEESQQWGWDNVSTVTDYLVLKGFDRDRIIFIYSSEDGGDSNTVDLRTSLPGEDGPSRLPPPHPCVSLHLPKFKRCKDLH